MIEQISDIFEKLEINPIWQSSVGKFNKTTEENINCFAVSTLQFLEDPTLKRKKKFDKYQARVTKLLDTDDHDELARLQTNKLCAQIHYTLLRNASSFDFEQRKEFLHNFKVLGKKRGTDSVFLENIIKNSNFPQFIKQIIRQTQNPEMLGFCGSLLRYLSKTRYACIYFLDEYIFQQIILSLEGSNLSVISEFKAILETIAFKSQSYCQQLYSQFLEHNYENFFSWMSLSSGEHHKNLFIRNMYHYLYEVMRHPIYKNFKVLFLHDRRRLMSVLMNLVSDNNSVRFEACLLLNLFVQNFELIKTEEIRRILITNKHKLLKAIQAVDFYQFDESCEFGVCYEQLNFQIKQLPKIP